MTVRPPPPADRLRRRQYASCSHEGGLDPLKYSLFFSPVICVTVTVPVSSIIFSANTKCLQTCLVVFFQDHNSKPCLPFIVDLNPQTLHSSVAFAGSLTRKDPPSFILPRGVLFPCKEAFPSNSIFRMVCWMSVVCGPAEEMMKLSNIRL